MKKRYVVIVLVFSAFLAYGIKIIHDKAQEREMMTLNTKEVHDRFDRLTSYPGKTLTDCPEQNERTGVILTFGQSNSANSSKDIVKNSHVENVYNFFDGNCYFAKSPLLGATGAGGEFSTILADKLIDAGIYKNIIILSSGIAGTKIDDGRNRAILIQCCSQKSEKFKNATKLPMSFGSKVKAIGWAIQVGRAIEMTLTLLLKH